MKDKLYRLLRNHRLMFFLQLILAVFLAVVLWGRYQYPMPTEDLSQWQRAMQMMLNIP